MIRWKPNDLFSVFVKFMTEWSNYALYSFLQAELSHFNKLTSAFSTVKDAVNNNVLHFS